MENFYLIIAIIQVACIGYAMPRAYRILTFLIVNKNREWVAANPEFKAHKIIDGFIVYYHRLVAFISAVAIVNFAIISPSPEYYERLLFYPLYGMGGGFIIFAPLQYLWLTKAIPAPKNPRASLTSRTLGNYVSMPVFILSNILPVFVLGLSLYAYFVGLDDRMLYISGALLFGYIWCNGFAILGARRKYNENEAVFGEKGRKYEVWSCVGGTYFFSLIGINQLWRAFFGTPLVSHMGASMLVLSFCYLFMLFHAFQPKTRALLDAYQKLLDRNRNMTVIQP